MLIFLLGIINWISGGPFLFFLSQIHHLLWLKDNNIWFPEDNSWLLYANHLAIPLFITIIIICYLILSLSKYGNRKNFTNKFNYFFFSYLAYILFTIFSTFFMHQTVLTPYYFAVVIIAPSLIALIIVFSIFINNNGNTSNFQISTRFRFFTLLLFVIPLIFYSISNYSIWFINNILPPIFSLSQKLWTPWITISVLGSICVMIAFISVRNTRDKIIIFSLILCILNAGFPAVEISTSYCDIFSNDYYRDAHLTFASSTKILHDNNLGESLFWCNSSHNITIAEEYYKNESKSLLFPQDYFLTSLVSSNAVWTGKFFTESGVPLSYELKNDYMKKPMNYDFIQNYSYPINLIILTSPQTYKQDHDEIKKILLNQSIIYEEKQIYEINEGNLKTMLINLYLHKL